MPTKTISGKAALMKATAPALNYDPDRTEKRWQARVIRYAKAHGWLVFFTHDSRHSPAGEPDLRLVRERVVWAELKGYDRRGRLGKLTELQEQARDALRAAGQEWWLWSPDDEVEMERVLD